MGLLQRLTDVLKGKQPTRTAEPHPHTGNLDVIDQTGPFPVGSLNLNDGFKPVKGNKPAPSDIISGPPVSKRVLQASATVDLDTFHATVRQHVVPLGATWLRDFWQNTGLETEHGITKVYVDGGPVLIQLPGNILAEVDEDGLSAYELTDPDAPLWLLRGGQADTYIDEETGELTVDGEDYDLDPQETWPEWDIVPDTNPIRDLTVGGPTDFPEREGNLWPHYRLPGGEEIPLHYVATFVHRGELYDFFYDFTSNEFLDTAYGSEQEHHYMSAYAFLAHKPEDRITPPWVVYKALPVGESGPLAESKRHQLPTEAPRAPYWVQYTEVPSAPHNRFVIEIPSVGDLMFGDAGSIYIFSDGGKELRGVYQCY